MIGGSSPGRIWEFFTSPPRPDRLWVPPSLRSSGYQGLFPWMESGRGVKLTAHLHLVLKVNAWSNTATPQYAFMARYLVKHRDNFAFTFLNFTSITYFSEYFYIWYSLFRSSIFHTRNTHESWELCTKLPSEDLKVKAATWETNA
jgi:hypothetical protein